MSASTAPDAATDLVGGRYRLVELIGAGGMGRVWLAQDELLQRRVAIKEIVIPADIRASELLGLRSRTMREARAAARLDHPHLVGVFDVLWRPDRSWIVMEHVPSRSLQQVLDSGGPLRHREAARIGLGLVRALRAAHGAGVLHRDVKPPNVLLAEDGRVVLSDFGLATFDGARDGTAEKLTGSPLYLAPERLGSAGPDPAADLWSLGATLYAAVEGRPPFARSSTALSLAALRAEPPDPPRHPGPLHAMINDLLAKDPAQRMTAADAEESLRRIAERTVGIFRPPPHRRLKPPPPAGHPVIGRATAAPASGAPRRAHRARRIGIAVLLLVAAAVGGGILLPDGERPAIRPAATVVGCGPIGALTTALGTPPYAVPSGWVWHTDPAGFGIAVPGVWTRAPAPGGACFADRRAAGMFTVDTRAPATPQPLPYWQAAETTALADGSLPGYQRIGMDVLPLKLGAADWEYSWQPATGPRSHVRRVLLSMDNADTYLVQWTAPDPDWAATVALQQRMVDSITPL
jgi:hypothetical protein